MGRPAPVMPLEPADRLASVPARAWAAAFLAIACLVLPVGVHAAHENGHQDRIDSGQDKTHTPMPASVARDGNKGGPRGKSGGDTQTAQHQAHTDDLAKYDLYLTALQTGLNSLSLLGVVFTVLAANSAAKSARSSAEAANQTLNAMILSEQRQLRAYLSIEDPRVYWSLDGPFYVFDVLNTGQTPAIYFELGVHSEIIPRGEFRQGAPPPTLVYSRWNALPGGRERSVQLLSKACEIRESDLPANDSMVLRAVGRLRYLDIFDQAWESEFCYFIGATGHLSDDNRSKMSQPNVPLKSFAPISDPGDRSPSVTT